MFFGELIKDWGEMLFLKEYVNFARLKKHILKWHRKTFFRSYPTP